MSGLKFDANNLPYIPLGELTVRLESEEPTDLVKERARTELRETPEVSAAAIDELRALIKGNTLRKTPIIIQLFEHPATNRV